MYKIAILGCENTHANSFLSLIKNDERFSDVEVIGVYTDEPEAAAKIKENFGVDCADSYDAFVGKVDGIVITARHGANHYKYAKPYISSGIPMYIDKPFCCDDDEALKFARELKANGCRITGGTICIHAHYVKNLKMAVKSGSYGKVLGGMVRTPVHLESQYGGFFFYAQHLAQIVQEIFGYYPKSVTAHRIDKVVNVTIKYDDYDVFGQYVDGQYSYYASISCEKDIIGDVFPLTSDLSATEFMNFYKILKGGEQETSYRDLIAPVYLITALNRAIESGKEEPVLPVGEI